LAGVNAASILKFVPQVMALTGPLEASLKWIVFLYRVVPEFRYNLFRNIVGVKFLYNIN